MRNRFLDIVQKTIKREGSAQLLDWLEKSDFFQAPASTRYHGNHRGGLVLHSLNVYDRLVELNQMYTITDNAETIAIVSLFHDVAKIDCYKQDFRNVKNDAGIWEKVPCYTFDEKLAFGGHGSKSVYLIQKFMQLTDQEAVCINTHMGAFDKPVGDYSIANAFEMFPLALLLHTADMLATCIDEKNSNTPQQGDTTQQNPVDDLVKQIIDLCVKLIDKGTDKEGVYGIISAHNEGRKNPNSIRSIEVAQKIIKQLKEELCSKTMTRLL